MNIWELVAESVSLQSEIDSQRYKELEQNSLLSLEEVKPWEYWIIPDKPIEETIKEDESEEETIISDFINKMQMLVRAYLISLVNFSNNNSYSIFPPFLNNQ